MEVFGHPSMHYCHLCDEHVGNGRLLDHYRLLHPDEDAAPEAWPDGERVIYDDCPEAADAA